jgi:hypothetical protein
MNDSKLNLHSFFITPVFSFLLEGYSHLKDEVIELKKEDQIGVKGRSTNGGWHSKDNLHTQPSFSELKSEIFNFADEAFSPPKVENHSIHVAHRVNFKPQNGTLLLFPSYLNHEVEENNSQEDRIVVSFNIHFTRR